MEPDDIKDDPAAWKRIGEEISEQLDYEPARFFKRRTVRPKYVRRGDGETPPVIAPLPPSLQDAGLAAPGLLAAIITASRAERDSQPAGCPEGVRAVRRRAANTATTSRSTVRNTSIRRATALISPVKPCPAG